MPPDDTTPPPAAPETVGTRSTRTETTIRWYDADDKMTGETTTTHRVWQADDKPFPDGGYL